jgi:LemA protein
MYLPLIVVFALAVLVVVLYNRLIRSRNRVSTAWSDIDVQLQRRHDLIPQIVKAVDAYAKYERATLEAVTELRAEAMQVVDVNARGKVEEELSAVACSRSPRAIPTSRPMKTS